MCRCVCIRLSNSYSPKMHGVEHVDQHLSKDKFKNHKETSQNWLNIEGSHPKTEYFGFLWRGLGAIWAPYGARSLQKDARETYLKINKKSINEWLKISCFLHRFPYAHGCKVDAVGGGQQHIVKVFVTYVFDCFTLWCSHIGFAINHWIFCWLDNRRSRSQQNIIILKSCPNLDWFSNSCFQRFGAGFGHHPRWIQNQLKRVAEKRYLDNSQPGIANSAAAGGRNHVGDAMQQGMGIINKFDPPL